MSIRQVYNHQLRTLKSAADSIQVHLPLPHQARVHGIFHDHNAATNQTPLRALWADLQHGPQSKQRQAKVTVQHQRDSQGPLYEAQQVHRLSDSSRQAYQKRTGNPNQISPCTRNEAVPRRLLNLVFQVIESQDLDILPGTFNQGRGRPARTPSNLPPREVQQRQRRKQPHENVTSLFQFITSDVGGLQSLHQPDDRKIYTSLPSGAIRQLLLQQGGVQRGSTD